MLDIFYTIKWFRLLEMFENWIDVYFWAFAGHLVLNYVKSEPVFEWHIFTPRWTILYITKFMTFSTHQTFFPSSDHFIYHSQSAQICANLNGLVFRCPCYNLKQAF